MPWRDGLAPFLQRAGEHKKNANDSRIMDPWRCQLTQRATFSVQAEEARHAQAVAVAVMADQDRLGLALDARNA